MTWERDQRKELIDALAALPARIAEALARRPYEQGGGGGLSRPPRQGGRAQAGEEVSPEAEESSERERRRRGLNQAAGQARNVLDDLTATLKKLRKDADVELGKIPSSASVYPDVKTERAFRRLPEQVRMEAMRRRMTHEDPAVQEFLQWQQGRDKELGEEQRREVLTQRRDALRGAQIRTGLGLMGMGGIANLMGAMEAIGNWQKQIGEIDKELAGQGRQAREERLRLRKFQEISGRAAGQRAADELYRDVGLSAGEKAARDLRRAPRTPLRQARPEMGVKKPAARQRRRGSVRPPPTIRALAERERLKTRLPGRQKTRIPDIESLGKKTQLMPPDGLAPLPPRGKKTVAMPRAPQTRAFPTDPMGQSRTFVSWAADDPEDPEGTAGAPVPAPKKPKGGGWVDYLAARVDQAREAAKEVLPPRQQPSDREARRRASTQLPQDVHNSPGTQPMPRAQPSSRGSALNMAMDILTVARLFV